MELKLVLYHDTCPNVPEGEFPELVKDPDYFIDGIVGYKCPKCDLVIGAEIVVVK